MGFMFEKLEVYQRAVTFSGTIYSLAKTFPKTVAFLSDQAKSASTSICLNIAEGNGRWHKNERRKFFLIARGSCFECVPALELMKANDLIDQDTYKKLREEAEIIGKMLTALINNIVRN